MYDLFIFDLDDTLVMTEKIHYKCWIETLKYFNPSFEMDFTSYCLNFHPKNDDGIQRFIQDIVRINDWKLVLSQKQSLYFEKIKDISNTRLNDGVEKFIEQIILSGKKFVIVSNSKLEHITIFLNLYPILQKCTKIYHRDMFENKKPNPECYIKVTEDFPDMAKIGFEDSLTGIHAMSQVPNIDVIFVNSPEYIHYSSIINTYPIKQNIQDFKEVNINI